ncbi:unnamed protein product [Rhizoctonia solani]|uniref:NACHT domain-containing protein n=1 Tax=Rhizoctonia solani TaxID=456999 RepID=A0A8H2Y1U6_9AGAM|nr:unnamed protein product [Rhizoctonia solani]
MSNANRSSWSDPFRACLSWMGSCLPPSPTLQEPEGPAEQLELVKLENNQPVSSAVIAVNPPSSGDNIEVTQAPASEKSDSWKALNVALTALEGSISILPPLKIAVSGLLACSVHIQVAEHNRQEYDHLAQDLVQLIDVLMDILPKAKPKWIPRSIENVARAINEQVAYIKRQQNKLTTHRIAQALEDEAEIVARYQRIGTIFHRLQLDIQLSVWSVAEENRVDTQLKDLSPVKYAFFNTALPLDIERHACTEDTRLDVLSKIQDWTQRDDTPKIYWMSGMAGTGKTTITYSLCKQLDERKQLGGSFFCSSTLTDCQDVNRIIPTLTYQLARFSNAYQNALCEVLRDDPDVAARELPTQFEKLLVAPLKKVANAIPTDATLVIDALDECSSDPGITRFLVLLFKHASTLPIKFFLTSRPEPTIANKIRGYDDLSRLVFDLHEIQEDVVQADIRTYLKRALDRIKPQGKEIEQLVSRAGRLFIFAATVVRYIEPDNLTLDHDERLRSVLDTDSTTASGGAYKEIDKLYLTILSKALDGSNLSEHEVSTRKRMLGTIICARGRLTVDMLAKLMGVNDIKKVEAALQPFRSVLQVSGGTRLVTTLHTSFPEFLLDNGRAAHYRCESRQYNGDLAARCFDLMKSSLKFNICQLESSSQFDDNVPKLPENIDESISAELFYACRYWGDHFRGAELSDSLISDLEEFLEHRLLFWVEVLNLKKSIGHGTMILLQALNSIMLDNNRDELRQFINDARNFVITVAANPISRSTPHIYTSALLLTPRKSKVWKTYWRQARKLPNLWGSAVEQRAAALATWTTGSSIYKIVISSDGTRILSAHADGTVNIWDASNGKLLLGPLYGHSKAVWSVAFSRDRESRHFASGSFDCTVRIYNSRTGKELLKPLEGHSNTVAALAFSPDGSRLASSSDARIYLWDLNNGNMLTQSTMFEGHTDWVMSLVFSLDGKCLVSGSDDSSIRFWDASKGTTIAEPLLGHAGWVDTVTFSPDDSLLASSSTDLTIRVWNTQTKKLQAGPFRGHTDRVISISFSPDGKRIASGSFDRSVRVWNIENGETIAGPFSGHSDLVYSVVFSQDGTHILSASEDGTIYIWDASGGVKESVTAASGHTGAILSVAFSSDGSRAVSGSDDKTICIWDIHDDALHLASGPLEGHGGKVNSVVFSSDDAYVISGSADSMVRTWDAHTGLVYGEPYTGHTDEVLSVAISLNGRFIASGSADYTVRVYNFRNDAVVQQSFTGHTDWVRSVTFSPDETQIASGSDDRTIRVWDPNNGTLLHLFEDRDWVRTVKFSPNGMQIISGCDDLVQ